MEPLILGNTLGPDAIEITKLIGKEIIRWVIDVAIFLISAIGVLILRSDHVDREAKREEIWNLLRDEIRLGDAGGAEETRRWFVERLGTLEHEKMLLNHAHQGEQGGMAVQGCRACEMAGRKEDEEWKRGQVCWSGDGVDS